MEHLTKTQIVLLTLLVSFVTSIATGIVTVTLMDQAPPGITSTINRVVERTIERIVPDTSAPIVAPPTKDIEELTVEAIQKIKESIVDFYLVAPDGSEELLSRGLVLSKEGVVISAHILVTDTPDEKIIARYKGAEFTTEILEVKEYTQGQLSFIKLIPRDSNAGSQATTTQKIPARVVFTPVSVISNRDKIKLGQTVITVGFGYPGETVGRGIVSRISDSLPDSATGDTKSDSILILTDISRRVSEFSGPMLNIQGDLIGIAQAHDTSEFVFGFFTEDMIVK